MRCMSDLWPNMRNSSTTAMQESESVFEPESETAVEFTEPTEYRCTTCEDADALETIGAEVICVRCGSIIDVPLEWAAEYRWFSSESGGGGTDPSRTSFPVNHLMPESSLGTMILNRSGASPAMRRIKRYHMWNMMPYRERTLWGIFDGLQTRASNAGIGSAIIDEVKELYAQLTASTICRGQNQRDAILAACLWETLRRHGTPRMPRDISEIFQLDLKTVTKGIKQFQHILAMRLSGNKVDTYVAPTPAVSKKTAASTSIVTESAEVLAARAFQRRAAHQQTAARTTSYEDFVAPFLTNMRVANPQLDALVRAVCARTDELNIVPENTPVSLTASVISFCMKEMGLHVDHAELARVCGISAVTIQKCIKRLMPYKKELLAIQ